MDPCNSPTLNQALNKFQTIFPSLPFPILNQHPGSFLDSLENFTSSIPLPKEEDLSDTLQSIQAIMDDQQYRYQASILPEPVDQMMLFDEECNYEQCSTGILSRKVTCGQENQVISFGEDIWNWKSDKRDNQMEDYCLFID